LLSIFKLLPVSLLYDHHVKLPSVSVTVPLGDFFFFYDYYFFLEVTQNAIMANEKPANSITEANENGTGDSALKALFCHRFPASKLTRGPPISAGKQKSQPNRWEGCCILIKVTNDQHQCMCICCWWDKRNLLTPTTITFVNVKSLFIYIYVYMTMTSNGFESSKISKQ